MGESKRKQERQLSGTVLPVELRLDAPRYKITEINRTVNGEVLTKKAAAVKVTCNLLQTAVQAKYPAGLDSRDARIWGRISEILQDEPEKASFLESDFDWLRRMFTDEQLRMPVNLSHWRINLEDYLNDIRDEIRKRGQT